MPRWAWWEKSTGDDEHRIRELLRAVWELHAMYGGATWLWRGQPNCDHDITPAAHTRVGAGITDDSVKACMRALIDAARAAKLDVHEGTVLPDLALLAMLQHHGAGTPLLDVSLDPLVALYMAVVSSNPSDDAKDGALFAIQKPPVVHPSFETTRFEDVYDNLPADKVVMYSAPEVSERLRIQRGHFLLGRYHATGTQTSLPVSVESTDANLEDTWLYRLMAQRGNPAPARRSRPTSWCFALRQVSS